MKVEVYWRGRLYEGEAEFGDPFNGEAPLE
jgi:hypothetical protein